ncbi:MAG TPA: tetratricopeptide repeat protein, partial [Thermoanaerobaculia bacterium]
GLAVLAIAAAPAMGIAARSLDEVVLLASAASEQAAPAKDAELYERGTSALDSGDWASAADSFQQVVKMGGSRADGALYWLAYARNKQGRRDEALAILREFSAKFPKSSWGKEARALELEIRPSSGRAVLGESSTDDEDLKLMAINSLMNTEPERAMPLLEKVLNGPASPKLKERALFVLSQSGSTRARGILADAARGKSGPDLQEKAIHYLGVSGGRSNGELLEEIYASTPNREIKEKVLHAFMVSGNKDRILAAARGEKSPELRASAVHWLGTMGARAELWQMYRSETSTAVKESLIHAMSIAGDTEHLAEIARTDGDTAARAKAIHGLGIAGRERSGAALLAIYRGEKNLELRKAVLHGLFIQNNARALVDIARTETDPNLKAEAVHRLSLMHDKDATDYMLEILNR